MAHFIHTLPKLTPEYLTGQTDSWINGVKDAANSLESYQQLINRVMKLITNESKICLIAEHMSATITDGKARVKYFNKFRPQLRRACENASLPQYMSLNTKGKNIVATWNDYPLVDDDFENAKKAIALAYTTWRDSPNLQDNIASFNNARVIWADVVHARAVKKSDAEIAERLAAEIARNDSRPSQTVDPVADTPDPALVSIDSVEELAEAISKAS